MKCAVCNQELDIFRCINLDNNVKVHIGCFFNPSIPDPPNMTDINAAELDKQRKEAIERRVIEIKNSINRTE